MVDENKDMTQEKPAISSGRAAKKEVDLFPALADKRMAGINAIRSSAPTKVGTQISLFTPMSFDEALDIVECLRCRAATTISLENMKKIDASRLVDFVAGASAALDGDFHKLSEQVYLFCPSNIRITAPGKQVAKSGATMAPGALDFLYPDGFETEGPRLSTSWTSV